MSDDDDDEVSREELIDIPSKPENVRAPGEGPPNPQPKGPEDTGVAAPAVVEPAVPLGAVEIPAPAEDDGGE